MRPRASSITGNSSPWASTNVRSSAGVSAIPTPTTSKLWSARRRATAATASATKPACSISGLKKKSSTRRPRSAEEASVSPVSVCPSKAGSGRSLRVVA
jgi:hypothetical protein